MWNLFFTLSQVQVDRQWTVTVKDWTVRVLTWAVLMAASDSGIGSGIFDGSFNILAVLLFSGFQSDDHFNDSYYITHKV